MESQKPYGTLAWKSVAGVFPRPVLDPDLNYAQGFGMCVLARLPYSAAVFLLLLHTSCFHSRQTPGS
jgi:hypothetical protein